MMERYRELVNELKHQIAKKPIDNKRISEIADELKQISGSLPTYSRPNKKKNLKK